MSVDSTKLHFIPERWKPVVAQHVLRTRGKEEERLSASDFRADCYVRLRFEDKSEAIYQYAFCLRSKKLGEVAIFTEHCGYYFYIEEIVTVEQMQIVQEN